jgi:pre-mRNA-processing factor 19
MLHCALSGEVPSEPVASPKSGGVFERRTIEKHIEQFGTDPISKAPLAKEELIALALRQPVVRPRPPAAASVPALLSTLQK